MTIVTAGEWTIRHERGTVADLHALGLPADVTRLVRWCEPVDAALVLGSAQREDAIHAGRVSDAGLSVVRRRSGGGAVVVRPGDLAWADVLIPRSDELWLDDVGGAFDWLGMVIHEALRSLGYEDVAVHRGALVATEWSKLVCFAGLGPGECLVGGRKAVGISQRRTRDGALFQISFLRSFDAREHASFFDLGAGDLRRLASDLERTITTLDVAPDVLEAAFVRSLSAHA